MSEDLMVLREILQRELETINAYEAMLRRISDPTLRQIIEHVTDEEREHVAEMYHLIVERDPQQKAREERGHAQLVGMSLLAKAPAASVGGELDGAAAASPPGAVLTPVAESDPNPSPPHFFADGDWSVGPLKVRSA